MDPLGTASGIESRFAAYVEHLAPALGHADRAVPFRAYCTGLILPGERKSVEPMAARVDPRRVGSVAKFQRRRLNAVIGITVGITPPGAPVAQ